MIMNIQLLIIQSTQFGSENESLMINKHVPYPQTLITGEHQTQP